MAYYGPDDPRNTDPLFSRPVQGYQPPVQSTLTAPPAGQGIPPAVAPAQPQGGIFGSLGLNGLGAPGGFVSQVGNSVGSNQNMLLGFAGGMLGGRKTGQGWGSGFAGAMAGSQLDLQKQQIDRKNAQADAQRKGLLSLGYTPEQIDALTPEGTADLWSKVYLQRVKAATGGDGSEATTAIKDAQFALPGDIAAQRQYVLEKAKLPQTQIQMHGTNARQDAGVKYYTKVMDQTEAAAMSIQSLRAMRGLVASGEFAQGTWSGPFQNKMRSAWAGITGVDDPGLTSYGRFKTLSGDFIKKFAGGSYGAGFSEGDRKAIEAIAATDDDAQTSNLGKIDAAIAIQQRQEVLGAMADGFYKENGEFDRSGYNKAITEYANSHPLFANSPISKSESPIQTPTLKDTGQTVNGKKVYTYGGQ